MNNKDAENIILRKIEDFLSDKISENEFSGFFEDFSNDNNNEEEAFNLICDVGKLRSEYDYHDNLKKFKSGLQKLIKHQKSVRENKYKLQPFEFQNTKIIPLKVIEENNKSLILSEWILEGYEKNIKYQEWYKNGEVHRDNDLPAVVFKDGEKQWWQNGKLHRENGPAVICENGNKQYHLNGEQLTKEKFLQKTQDIKKIDKDFQKITQLISS